MLRTLGRPVEQIAVHALALQPAGRDWVVTVLREAALIAVRRGAADDALAYLRRTGRRTRPRRRPAPAAAGTGDVRIATSKHAVDHLRAAYLLAPESADRGEIIDVLSLMSNLTDPPDDAESFMQNARVTLPAELSVHNGALEALDLCAVYFGAEDIDLG